LIVIYGEPMGKQRPRVCKGHAYTPEQTRNYEALVKISWLKEPKKYKGYIRADIRAYYKIPKGTSKVEENAMRNAVIRPSKKPDLDNVAKIILDALNGMAYDDDKQVVELHIDKYYSATPRVEVELAEIQTTLE
jgi:Holliday junction resolvase RusA-like endonuclease